MAKNLSRNTENYKSPFGLNREMGYTHQEFLKLLPRSLSEYVFNVQKNCVSIELENGTALIQIGTERVRRITDSVSFPILPIKIQFVDANEKAQSRFLQKFDYSYMKGLG